ncbi:MAG: hypothetical protein KC646_10120 [Candidatus Cloacimonetes bacterium]|nr:hypothetical protein [Candidatus Cloacimonadota bacterium]
MDRNKSKRVGISLDQKEYDDATEYAYKLRIPISTLARQLLMEAVNNNEIPATQEEVIQKRVDILESKIEKLLAWKKEVEASINANPPSLNDEELDIDWDEINENNIRNQEIIKKLEQRLKPQQNEEVYVPGSLDDDLGLKDKV